MHTATTGDNIEPTEYVLSVQALKALRTLMDVNSALHIQAVVTHLVKELLNNYTSDVEWATTVTCTATDWIPVQLRYIVMGRLREELEHPGTSKSPSPRKALLLRMIASLLFSKINVIGLNVLDTLNVFIGELVLQLETRSSDLVDAEEEKEMRVSSQVYMASLVRCISGLGNHVYYTEQVHDVCAELLNWIRPWLTSDTTNGYLKENGGSETSSHLDKIDWNLAQYYAFTAVEAVLRTANSADASGATFSNVSADLWSGTYRALASRDLGKQSLHRENTNFRRCASRLCFGTKGSLTCGPKCRI